MLISIVLGKVLNNWILSIKICGSIGLVCFGLAAILNGSFITRNGSNNSTDKEEDKIARGKITSFAMIIGSTNTILAIIIFFIINNS